MAGLGQTIQHPGHHDAVSAFRKPFFDGWPGKPLDPQRRLGRTEPLAHPLHEPLATPGDKQRELDRRTARVEHQHQTAMSRLARVSGRTQRCAALRQRLMPDPPLTGLFEADMPSDNCDSQCFRPRLHGEPDIL
jgi:hypothetical protein